MSCLFPASVLLLSLFVLLVPACVLLRSCLVPVSFLLLPLLLPEAGPKQARSCCCSFVFCYSLFKHTISKHSQTYPSIFKYLQAYSTLSKHLQTSPFKHIQAFPSRVPWPAVLVDLCFLVLREASSRRLVEKQVYFSRVSNQQKL